MCTNLYLPSFSDPDMNKNLYLVPYWFLNFTIGFGWFTLAPLVPSLIELYGVSLPSIIELISLYGYTMVAFALVSGYLAAKYSVSASLLMSGVLSVVGLFIRAISTDYSVLLVGQIIAAIAYPLALGPVGTIAQSLNQKRSHMIIGVSVGILFLGMSSGSFLGPYVFSALGTVKNVFLLDTVLALISLAILPLAVRKYPREYVGRSLKGSFSPGMIKNWYVGLIISSFSVMFGVIASTELIHKGISIPTALHYGGLFGGLAFLGSAFGAILLPSLFEDIKKVREGMILSSVAAFASLVLLAYYLSFTSVVEILSLSYFLFGFFGNAYWSMAMTSTTKYVTDPAKAGLSTSMYSVATNLGVAFIPVFLGPYFIDNRYPGIAIVAVMIAIGFILSFTLRVVPSIKKADEDILT